MEAKGRPKNKQAAMVGWKERAFGGLVGFSMSSYFCVTVDFTLITGLVTTKLRHDQQ